MGGGLARQEILGGKGTLFPKSFLTGIVNKESLTSISGYEPASDIPWAIQVFEYKCNWLIISSIQQLHYMFNEEEY